MSWWIWLIIAFVIGIIEMSTITFVLLWFAVAAAITAIIATAVHNEWWQLVVFAVIGLALFAATRPLARRWRTGKPFPTRNDTIIGKQGSVVTTEEAGGFATVRIAGELWSARSEVELVPGDTVVVQSASASIVTVAKVLDKG